uniref:SgcJ/EcaC family oxidoreductase n=1 Tax=Roseihalotalea indica TaxID=2867963 RepID=A0AA49GQ72_9BACT|nr:SgcJ/EcaC family oxidoreductase [Tunicatimonas sp. TK19036]
MKKNILLLLFSIAIVLGTYAQDTATIEKQKQEIESLIDQYAQAREKRDTVLLKSILTPDIDQLVSSGEWRDGVQASVQGMLRSSSSNPGDRILTVDKIRFIGSEAAIVDARYEIKNTDGTTRKMWSTFIVIAEAGAWKITAIRNMRPSEYS